MNLERLRWGEWIAGISALVLLLVTFRSWYTVSGTGVHVTAWDALDNGRYLLIATAVVGVFLLLVVAAGQARELSFPPGALPAVVGLACTVYVAYRLATPPADNLDADLGLYIGLAAALGVAAGGLMSVRDASAAEYESPDADEGAAPAGGPVGPTDGGLVPDTTGPAAWSPAPPAPAQTWGPASPAIAAATVAGAATALEERDGAPASQAGEAWTPAMPAAAGHANGAGLVEATKKVPWWKREIGGGKKTAAAAGNGAGPAELGTAGAPAAAPIAAATDEEPGLFKRIFGGGKTTEAGAAAELDTAVTEPAAERAADEPTAAASVTDEPTAAASATDEPATAASATDQPAAADPAAETSVAEAASEPEATEPEPGPDASAPEPEPEPQAAAPASEPASEPELEPEPEPEPEPIEPEPGPDPRSPSVAAVGAGVAAAGGALGAAAADAPGADDEPAPKVGETVQLKVPGGKYDAGSKGTVVDVFSAGVIVELTDGGGRTERLDLPFEAVAPAET